MKAGMIFASKRTWRSRLDVEYLDGTSSGKAPSRQQHADGPQKTRPLRQFADYASTETLGQVLAGGFLHHMILINEDGSRIAPSQLTNAESKSRISEAWFEHVRKYPTSSQDPVIQHRLVFSMSRDARQIRRSQHQSRSRVAVCEAEDQRESSTNGFHAADSIGYPCGICHDTDNLHVHVALCSRSARGPYVGCSTSRKPASCHTNARNRF